MATFSTKVKFEGPVFRRGASKNALRKAREASIEFGLKQIRSWTPVKTGRLKRGWTSQGDTILNEVPYTIYVEEGTRKMEGYFMVRDSLPRIEEHYTDLIQKYLRQEGLID